MLEEHPRYPGQTRAEVIARKWADRAEDEAKDCVPLAERVEGKPAEESDIDTGAIIEEAKAKAVERKRARKGKGKEE
jgi:acyl-CoA reductase-like NAD-dependent aldehyde dehydrogenase